MIREIVEAFRKRREIRRLKRKVDYAKKNMHLSDDGKRMKRYLEGIQKGEVNYVIGKYEEAIEKVKEQFGCSREEAIELWINTMDMLEGSEYE